MKMIVQVREGLVSNIVAIIFSMSLSGFIIWWGFAHDRVSLIVAFLIAAFWLAGCGFFISNIIKPKSAFLAIEARRLIWSVRMTESASPTINEMPLNSLRRLEFVLPKMKFEVSSRNYPLSELFLVDVHGTRRRLPMELWPGIHRDRIVAALKIEIPNIEVVEYIADAKNNQDL